MQDRNVTWPNWLFAAYIACAVVVGSVLVLLAGTVGYVALAAWAEGRSHAQLKRLVQGDTTVRITSLVINDRHVPRYTLTDPEALNYLADALTTAKEGFVSGSPTELRLSLSNGGSATVYVMVGDDHLDIAIHTEGIFDDPEHYVAWLPKPMPASFAAVHRYLRTGDARLLNAGVN